MSTLTSLPTNWPPLPPPYPVRRFTVQEYHRLLEAGILGEEDRVELLEGWIVPKMTRSPAHDVAIELIEEALRGMLPAGWRIRIQSAVTTADSEPEPDLAIVKGAIRDRANRHPGPADVGCVIEVAESSLDTDRLNKGRLFAAANVPIFWIVNLVESQVEVYTHPSGTGALPAGYRSRQDYQRGTSVPVMLDGIACGELAVDDLLP